MVDMVDMMSTFETISSRAYIVTSAMDRCVARIDKIMHMDNLYSHSVIFKH